MKYRITYALFVFSLILIIISCKKDTTEDDIMTAEKAKVEIRSANQQITNEWNILMETPGANTLQYLSNLTSDRTLKATIETVRVKLKNFNHYKINDIFLNANSLRSTQIDFLNNPGTYQFNYQLNDFELIQPSTTMLQLIFPANEQSFYNQQLNADLIVDNLEVTDSVPTMADPSLKIDLVEVLSGSYNSTLTSNGVPTSLSASLLMAPYQFQMSFSESGVNYSSTLSLKLNNQEIMGYNLALKYTPDMENVEKLTVSYLIPPLRFEGWFNVQAMQLEMEDTTKTLDITYLNSQMSGVVFQTVLDAQLGNLVFMLYTDPDNGDQSAQIAIVYEDGSWEWISDIQE